MNLAKRFINRYFFNSSDKRALANAGSLYINRTDKSGSNGIALIDIPDNPNELVEQIAFAKYFSENNNYRPCIYYPSFHLWKTSHAYLLLKYRMLSLSRGQRLAYKAGLEKGLDGSILNVKKREIAKASAFALWKELNNNSDLLSFKVSGVKLGVAIYDTYLRLYSKPTIDLSDSRLLDVIEIAYLSYYAIEHYFTTNNVKVVVLGHAVYNNWKILSDFAVSKGVDVYVTYNSRFPPIHHVNTHRGLQTIDHSNYKQTFSCLPMGQQVELRRLGYKFMSERISGHLDEGLSYMATSAYGKDSAKQIHLEQGKRPLVLMLHSFFDSPHIYSDMIFDDFLEWCNATLSNIEQNGLDKKYQVVLKPHPNRIEGEDKIIDEIVRRFPFVTRLSGKESNNSIIQCKPAAIITVYGTVAAEFSFAGVPVITCGDNPTSSFSFCFQSKSQKEYFDMIKVADQLIVSDEMRNEVGEYAYMHYLRSPAVRFSEYPFKRFQRGNQKKGIVNRIEGFSYDEFKKIIDGSLRAE